MGIDLIEREPKTFTIDATHCEELAPPVHLLTLRKISMLRPSGEPGLCDPMSGKGHFSDLSGCLI